jgi:prenylcysteine oxidase/farnesylcysteine lyase
MPIELGGSIFVDVNRIMVQATHDFNLALAGDDDPSSDSDTTSMPDLGIWDGNAFVLVTTKEDGWWDKAKLLWRYGLAPLRVNRLMKAAVGAFLEMYDEPVFPWRSIDDVVESRGLLGLTGVTGEQYLQANGVGEAFAREVVQASTRVNYASNLAHIHGLETMVCMATSGAMQIAGGNWRIFAHMLNSSDAITTKLNTAVSSIATLPNGSYTLTTTTGDTAHYDDIILASPLQFSNLTLPPSLTNLPSAIPYVRLHVTLFASPYRLSPLAFNLPASSPTPQYILTTLPATEPPVDKSPGSPRIWSISQHNRGVNSRARPPRVEYIYKIFSPDPIGADYLSHVLGRAVGEAEARDGLVNGTVSWVRRKVWDSYPREYPRVTFGGVRLDDDGDEGEGEGDAGGKGGLWYTSGFEAVISTMETSALSGRNVARLVSDAWVGKGKVEGEGEAVEEAEREVQEL